MTEPVHAVSKTDGSRYYDHPIRRLADGTTPEQYVSVTTALDKVDKTALKFWAAYGTASLAMDELPRLIKAVRRPDCGRTRAKDSCKECRPCIEYWLGLWHYRESERAKRRGSRVHKYREFWIRNGYWPQVEAGDEPYVKAYDDFIATYGLKPESWTLTECTVVNREFMYAGTLDGGLVVEPITEKSEELCAKLGKPDESIMVLDDLKTREKPEPAYYPESSLQLTGYRYAEFILLSNGQELPLPQVDGGIVVQVRGNGAFSCRPVDTSQQTFVAFLNAMWLYRWFVDCGDASVQVGSFAPPTGWEPRVFREPPVARPRPAKRAAKKATPRKAAAKKAAPPAGTTPPPAQGSGRTSTEASVIPLRPRDGKPGQILRDEDVPF